MGSNAGFATYKNAFIHSAKQRTSAACCMQGCVVDAGQEQVFKTWSLPTRSHSIIREIGENKELQMGMGLPGQAGMVKEGFLEEDTLGLCLKMNWPGEEGRSIPGRRNSMYKGIEGDQSVKR